MALCKRSCFFFFSIGHRRSRDSGAGDTAFGKANLPALFFFSLSFRFLANHHDVKRPGMCEKYQKMGAEKPTLRISLDSPRNKRLLIPKYSSSEKIAVLVVGLILIDIGGMVMVCVWITTPIFLLPAFFPRERPQQTTRSDRIRGWTWKTARTRGTTSTRPSNTRCMSRTSTRLLFLLQTTRQKTKDETSPPLSLTHSLLTDQVPLVHGIILAPLASSYLITLLFLRLTVPQRRQPA